MDERTRRLERRFYSDRDVDAQTILLKIKLQYGEIKKRALSLGAFMGHQAARNILVDDVKPNGVVWKGKLIKNVEMYDWVNGLNTWGFLIVYRAMIAMMKLSIKDERVQDKELISCLEEGAKLYRHLVDDPNPCNRKIVQKYQREVVRRLHFSWQGNRHYYVHNYLNYATSAVSTGKGCIDGLRRWSAIYDDDDVKQAIRNEMYPFLFGEYA